MPDSASDIVTRCPQCNTVFRVTPNQLAVADGVVRCGSCLAVFKAVDYKISAYNSALADSNAESPPQGPETDDDNLITDEEESGLELNDDIYDLDTDNKNKKISLFDRKLQPTSPHPRENADESWALDMLADLEEDDDDIEPIRINRSKKTRETNQERNSSKTPSIETASHQKESVSSTEKADANTRQKSATTPIEQKSFQAENKEPIILKDTAISDSEIKSKSKKGFSFFKSKKADQTISEQHNLEDNAALDDLTFDFDDTYEQEVTDNTKEFENDADSSLIDDHYISVDKNIDTSIRDTEIPDDCSQETLASPHISDEEIEDAMHSRTSYANERNDYLSGIQPAPVEMEWYESVRTQRWLWMTGATILGAILVIQIATFRFDTLSKNENYRPYYETACKLISCQLPNLIDTNKIRATNLVVRSHPSKADSLIIDAILINNASYDQPYPALKLEFSDLNNQLLANRDLQPSEYLRGELSGAKKMPANQPIQLSLAIIDPGETAVNYQLKVIKAKPQPQ
ncbi:MAG: putative Zn finger-like uncharacterized protein [Cellvibrionaceae bacterium]|jgi:predicted Zn finger-like uncharacterized protein